MIKESELSRYCPACDRQVKLEVHEIKAQGIFTYHCNDCHYLLWVKMADGRFMPGVDYARMESKKLSKQQQSLGKDKKENVLPSNLSSLPPTPKTLAPRPETHINPQALSPPDAEEIKEQIPKMKKEHATDPAVQIPKEKLVPNLGIVMVIEDSALLRKIMADMLVERNIARQVVPCADGREFIEEYYKMVRYGKMPGLAIVDFNMPIMNGAHAGLVIRSIEKGLDLTPVPMLYFSVLRADNKIKKLLKYLTKTAYVYKSDSDPNRLADRLAAVITNISGVHPAASASRPA